MQFSPEQSTLLVERFQKLLANNEATELKIRRIWWEMAGYRSRILAKSIEKDLGNRVQSGPFQGMQLTKAALEGNTPAPLLLGTYEHELHPVIARVIAHPYRNILNIGCSHGFYSVGLALRMPSANIYAYDIDEEARKSCQDMAELNQVAARIVIGAEFRGEDFAKFAGEETLVIMDIEGAELQLLDPVRYPELKKMAIIVELHDLFDRNISPTIRDRFLSSHEVNIIRNKIAAVTLSFNEDNGYIDPFDKFLMAWEGRGGPTPWAVMWPKTKD